MVFGLGSLGCGAVGDPIPPEDIGIEAKLQEERLRHQKQDQKDSSAPEKPITPIGEEDIILPPVSPALSPTGLR